MEVFLLFARLILSSVFGVAGVAKLFDRDGAEKAIIGFGLPKPLAKPLAVLLPMAEIVTAVLLLSTATAWTGAVFSVILLTAFVAGIGYNMIQGRAPDCHCFGQIHSEPVGWSVLIRNAVLLTVAAFLAVFAGENMGLSAFAWLGDLNVGERMQLVVGLAITGLLTAILVSLRKVLVNQIVLQRQIEVLELTTGETGGEKRLVERADAQKPSAGLPVGAIAPDFTLPDLSGRQITLEHLMMRGAPILLFFVSPNCNPCSAMLPTISGWQREFGKKLSIAFLSSGTPAENAAKFAELDKNTVILLQEDKEVAKLFRSIWTPGAVFLNADGTVGSDLATGDDAIYSLINKIRLPLAAAIAANGSGHALENVYLLPGKKQEATSPKAGQPAPNFTLPNFSGGENVNLTDFRGIKTMLLFWRATCPFCREIVEQMRSWNAGQNDYKLIVLAENEPEIEQARAFNSTVLIETDREVQRVFNSAATPSAVIINEEGTIISDIAEGADNIFALVGKY